MGCGASKEPAATAPAAKAAAPPAKPAPASTPAVIKADVTIEAKVRCPGRRRFALA